MFLLVVYAEDIIITFGIDLNTAILALYDENAISSHIMQSAMVLSINLSNVNSSVDDPLLNSINVLDYLIIVGLSSN
jgi:hypothetical protein